jgi:hypothetical protein
MLPYRGRFSLALLGLITLTCFVLSGPAAKDDAPKNDNPAAQDEQVHSSKVSHQSGAAAMNLHKELNLPFATLGALGSRISAARRGSDPVALAHAASELAVAEKVSGMKASLTSSAVLKEAARLGALRKQITELRAVQQVSQQVENDQETIQILKENIALTQQNIEAEKNAFAGNQEPTSAARQIVVNNYAAQDLTININAYYRTKMAPASSQVFTIDKMHNPAMLKAFGNEDIDVWGPINLWGRFNKYTWNIN